MKRGILQEKMPLRNYADSDVVCHKPDGAFYMMVDLPIDDTEDFLMLLSRDNNKNGSAADFLLNTGVEPNSHCLRSRNWLY